MEQDQQPRAGLPKDFFFGGPPDAANFYTEAIAAAGNLAGDDGGPKEGKLAIVSKHRSFVELLAGRMHETGKETISFFSLADFNPSGVGFVLVDFELLVLAHQNDNGGGACAGWSGPGFAILTDCTNLCDGQIEKILSYDPGGILCSTDSLIQSLAFIRRWMRGGKVISSRLAKKIGIKNDQWVIFEKD